MEDGDIFFIARSPIGMFNLLNQYDQVKMDAVTHLALGVCTAEIWLGHRGGKKILLYGAIAQVLPDIDTLPALYLPADRSLLIHRGFTHSLFFAFLAGLCLAAIVYNVFRQRGITFVTLFLFFCFQLTLHDLLDVCNSYGTGLLEPFSHQRFSVNLLYVADPFFTVWLLIGSAVLVFRSKVYPYRKKWAWATLAISACYVAYAALNKINVDERVGKSLRAQNIEPSGYFTTPTPLNCMLWYVVIKTDSCYYTGYSSVFDKSQAIHYQSHFKGYGLLSEAKGKHAVQNLINFADGYYTVSQSDDSPCINILRFGQVQGWANANAPFVLSYPLLATGRQSALLQKGRLAGWNSNSVKAYLRRIGGGIQ
jgi:inner membrane protein